MQLSTTPTAHSTEYCKAFQCASHAPDYQPISKLLGKDENAVLANLGMRTVATPDDGHCLQHAFIRTKEIKYENSDPCNERENKLLKLIKRMQNEFLLSKNIYSEFTTNVEALTKDMNDYLDRKVYTSNFADIAPPILATEINTVLNIIDVDKTVSTVQWQHRRRTTSPQND